MSQLTRAQLEALWIGNFAPDEANYDDIWESFFNLADDGSPTLDSLSFNLTAGVTPGEGEMTWDADDKTVKIGMTGGDVVQQVGQELLVYVKNSSGGDIDNGEVVYISGASGANPLIDLADAGAIGTARMIGMATENIPDNTFGYVTTFGLVRDIDTSAFSIGECAWLSDTTPGGLETAPPAGKFSVRVGTVIRSNASVGSIFMHPAAPLDDDPLLTGDSSEVGVTQEAAKAYADGTLSSSANGYQIFPSGLILQWGNPTLTTAPEVVNLPITFPNSGLVGFACDTGGITESVGVSLLSTTQITLDTVSGGIPGTVSFIAIGY